MQRRSRARPGTLDLRVEVGADARADRRPRVAVATRPIAIASGVSHAESLRPSPMGSRNAAPSQFSALPRLTSLELALPRPAAACWYDDLVGIYGPLSRAPTLDPHDRHARGLRFSFQQSLEVAVVARQDQSRYRRESFGCDDGIDRIRCPGLRLQLPGTTGDPLRRGLECVHLVEHPMEMRPIAAAAMNLGENRRRNDDRVALANGTVQGGSGVFVPAGQGEDPPCVQDHAPRPRKRLYRGHS